MTIVTALSILLYPDAQSHGQKQWRKTLLYYTGCCKVECLTVEVARLTDIVKGLEMKITKETDGRGRNEQCSHKKDEDRRLRGGRVSARKTNGERTRESMACRKVTGEKVTVDEGGQWDRRGEKFM